MRARWLRREGAEGLVVIFGGWSLGPAPFAHLSGAQDVLFLDDWREIPPDLALPQGYRERVLLAFSFGVAAAGHWLAQAGRDPFTRKVAVNGTLAPACPRHGIAPEQVRATADQLSPQSLARFAARAGAAPPEAPDLDALRSELHATLDRGAAPETRFDRILISRRDRIFPPSAMYRAWQSQAAAIRDIDAPHCPFARWSNWAEIAE